MNFTFNVPSGKTLIVRSVNVFAGSYNLTDTFSVVMHPDDGSTSFLAFGMNPIAGGFSSWADTWGVNEQIQMSATQTVQGQVWRVSTNSATSCTTSITISGELT